MNSEGNLDQLRRRIIEHLRVMGKTDGGPSISPGTLPAAPTNTPLDRIRKWGGPYDGGKEAAEFLQRIEDLQYSYQVSSEQFLPCRCEILNGQILSPTSEASSSPSTKR